MEGESFWRRHGRTIGIIGGIIGGGALLIAGLPIALGFGTAGIVGGSAAAGIQAIIGNVAAGSLFATLTSLGATGVLATTAVVGSILGAGGLVAYLKGKFDPKKDAELISAVIDKRDNPDIILKLLEFRSPDERNKIREKYNELNQNDNLNTDNNINHRDLNTEVKDYMPDNLKSHVENLLRDINEISANSNQVKNILNNGNFGDYFEQETDFQRDSYLIHAVIINNDNPLIIVRLLEMRTIDEREKINKKYKELTNKRMLLDILDFMPGHVETSYLHILLNKI